MGKLSDMAVENSVKLLLIGDSGAGKTGSLASLAAAGYRLHIIDLENKLTVLKNYILATCPDKLQNVYAEVVMDKFKIGDTKATVAGRSSNLTKLPQAVVFDGAPDIRSRIGKLWRKWDIDGEEVVLSTLDPDTDIVVIDSLTALSNAIMREYLAVNNRADDYPNRNDYSQPQEMLRRFLELVAGPSASPNLILIAHSYQEMITKFVPDSTGRPKEVSIPGKIYPLTIGAKLAPDIQRYFSHILEVRRAGKERFIHTQPTTDLELKCPLPDIEPKFPIETGLADYFQRVRGKSPEQSPLTLK